MNEKPAPPVLRRKARVKLWLQLRHEYYWEIAHWKKPTHFYMLLANICWYLHSKIN